MANFQIIKNKLFQSKLFKDSFWAVAGNGFGNLLIMISGIIIARLLGKDLYGEYGVVKTTMLYIASFATFGLGVTSTKYVSQFVAENMNNVRRVIKDSVKITLSFSSILALLLLIFAEKLAIYLGEPTLKVALRILACIIVFRALTTTYIAILGGLKEYRKSAINNFISGFVLIILCIPFTYFFSLKGALTALLVSQLFNFVINFISVKTSIYKYPNDIKQSYTIELIHFSFPVALQESSIWICNWICIMLLTKMSSEGEVGLYTAAAQWNAVIAMLPSLSSNVVLSYIADSVNDNNKHNSLVKKFFLINLSSTIIPFIIVYLCSEIIASFYGNTFIGLKSVIRVLTLNAVLESCAHVFKAEYITANKAWLFFSLRITRDTAMTLLAYFSIVYFNGENGALVFSAVIVFTSLLYLIATLLVYRLQIYRK